MLKSPQGDPKESAEALNKWPLQQENSASSSQKSLSKDGVQNLALEDFVTKMSQSISMPQASPEIEEQRLKEKALQLTTEELARLKKLALKNQVQQDSRFAALYLLSFSEKSEALDELYEIAGTPWPQDAPPRPQEFERALRSFAVEAMGLHPEKTRASGLLGRYLEKESDSFLFDRAQRTRNFLEGKAPHPRLQDEKALRKLLQTER
ncbi:MAG: hypothetical protein LW875_07310 [Proteobacteria bacterium]|nr:hypothetical protein [Pseudomonadota bacterium]